MGILLKRVLSTNNKGLIGITESGEEVPLSKPIPRMTSKRYKEPCTESLTKKFRKDIRGIIEKSCGEGTYIQLGKINYFLMDVFYKFIMFTQEENNYFLC